MDEYRPYPTNQPDDEQDSEDSSAESGQPDQPVSRDYRSSSAVSDTPNARGEELEPDDEGDEGDQDDDGPDGNGRHPDRATPNLDHPGGHLTGTVARLNRPRRFGFLKTEDAMEIFFHASALESGPSGFDALRSGQPVEFDCHQDEQGRGLAATLVQVTGPPPPDAQPAQPRQPRPSREERRANRAEREDKGEGGQRGERGRGGREQWRVVVLRDRPGSAAPAQLEELLNQRRVKPGQFTLSLVEGDDGTECWVAIHGGDDGRR